MFDELKLGEYTFSQLTHIRLLLNFMTMQHKEGIPMNGKRPALSRTGFFPDT